MTKSITGGNPRVGVIGTGAIGRIHIRAWGANGIVPVAFADANPEALAATVAEHGGTSFAHGQDLIASGLIDLVSICTPPRFHRPLALAALDAGIGVLCEKPLARTLEDASAIAEAVARTEGFLTVGFCHRFQPQIEALKRMVDSGELGTVMQFRNRFAGHNPGVERTWFANPDVAGGGVLTDTSIHSIDLFHHLIGEPVRIQALTSTREIDLGPALDVEDTATLTVQTADGTIGTIESSWRTPVGEWTVTVFGTAGTAVVDYADETLRVKRPGGDWETVDVPPGDRFTREFANVVAAWRGDEPLRVTVEDGLAANRVLDMAYRSAGPTRHSVP